jgi:ADP-ribose pyrophosphatase YjhB (NUDIX family)
VSVDCVVFGFHENKLYILLVRRTTPKGSAGSALKLPGSLIFQQEDADEAAYRVLNELTGIQKIKLKQFRAFTSPHRTADRDDVNWLEYTYHNKIDRLITVAYLSLCKITRKLNTVSKYSAVEWLPVDKLPRMPFDHNLIVRQSLDEIRRWVEKEPLIIAELLPTKFTISQLRSLFEAINNKTYDVSNFYKKLEKMDYIVPLDEFDQNATRRASRLYKFDKVKYKKWII